MDNNKFTFIMFVISIWTAILGYIFKSWHNKLETRITTLEQEIKILPAVDAKLTMLIDLVKDKN